MNEESYQKLANEMNVEILNLREQLKIAEDTLDEIAYSGYLTPLYPPWQAARLGLEKIKKIKMNKNVS